jgi:hypothetical protein
MVVRMKGRLQFATRLAELFGFSRDFGGNVPPGKTLFGNL